MITKGRCLCGTVQFEIDGPFSSMTHCHCSICRKHHGAAFATFVAAPLGALRFTVGESSIERYESSPGVHRAFCRICGSVVPVARTGAGLVIAPAGNLNGDPGLKPQMHKFTSSKARWYDITDELPQDAGPIPQTSAQVMPQPLTNKAQGSCLCGDVGYEISAPPLRMFYCHCSRCRRARGAPHAANVFYPSDGFRWVRGADQVQDFQLPEARYFGISFCRRCGGAVPRISIERGMASVPAGSLDTDTGIEVTARIYVESRAPWDEVTDSIVQFAQMPPTR